MIRYLFFLITEYVIMGITHDDEIYNTNSKRVM
jgi:hypothetical protein